jgi:hypothetical protein
MNRNNRPGGMEFRSFKKDGQTLSSRNLDQPIDVVSCDVVAWASVRASAADLPGLRKAPGTLGDQPMANGLLRHVDEQTVVAVAAVLQAVRDSGLEPSSFDRWSVLAAPRFLGRAKFEASFPEYRDEGAWSVSPHLIPGHSLHSPSGTISQALHAHGANLGIGGTHGGEREAFLVAATWLEAGWSEGVWIILTTPKRPAKSPFPSLATIGPLRSRWWAPGRSLPARSSGSARTLSRLKAIRRSKASFSIGSNRRNK